VILAAEGTVNPEKARGHRPERGVRTKEKVTYQRTDNQSARWTGDPQVGWVLDGLTDDNRHYATSLFFFMKAAWRIDAQERQILMNRSGLCS
jgi:hypothetical protein